MDNRRSLGALGAGIATATLSFALLHQRALEIEKKTSPVLVLTATRFIPAGVFLDNSMVEKKSVPLAYASPSGLRDLKEVEGLMTLVPISAGEQIMANKFGAGQETLATALAPGCRAYTLQVSETAGVGGLLKPGNRVDVLAQLSLGKKEVTSFIYQNLQVLATGQRLDETREAKNTQEETAEGGGSGYDTVTLSVTPEQAETLFFLEGRPLRLVLRAPNDDAIASIPQLSEAQALSRLGHFTPSRNGLEVIRNPPQQGE
jgi:pilus assembly protein CpaB